MLSSDDVSFLRDLILRYSPSKYEQRACIYLKERLTGWGFEAVRIDKVGNVLAEMGKGGPVILLCGHIDTVTGRVPVRVEDDRIFGRGAVDAKGPLAAMALAARDYEGGGKLILCAAVGEESDSRGVAYLSSLPKMADVAIFGEPTGLRAAAFAHRGSMSIKVKIRSAGGHSASPWGFKNAVEEGFLIFDKIRNSLCHGLDKFSTPSVTITQMRGGGSGNRIPDQASMTIDVRFPPPWSVEEMLSRVRKVFEGAASGCAYSMEMTEGTEPYLAQKDSVVVESLRGAIAEALNMRLMLVKKAGSGDMGLVGRNWGIPVITYGPCDPRLSHTSGEYMELGEIEIASEIYRCTCERIASAMISAG